MSQAGIINIEAGNLPPSVSENFQTDSGTAIPVANTIIFHGVGGVFSASGNTVTFTTSNIEIVWLDESVTFSATAQHGYFCTGALTANLPATPSQGDTIIIYVDSASVVTIKANTGQTIQLGSTQSSAAGTAISTAEGSTLTLVYRTSDTEWHSISAEGSWILA